MSKYIKYTLILACTLLVTLIPVSAETQTINETQTLTDLLKTLEYDTQPSPEEQIDMWVASKSYEDLDGVKTTLENQSNLTDAEQTVLQYTNQKLSRRRIGLYGGASIVLIMFSLFITVLFISNR